MSSIPPVVRITLAPVAKIFWILSFVISDSLQGEKLQKLSKLEKTFTITIQYIWEMLTFKTFLPLAFSENYIKPPQLKRPNKPTKPRWLSQSSFHKPLSDLVQLLRVWDNNLHTELHFCFLQAEVKARDLCINYSLGHTWGEGVHNKKDVKPG